jgi:hypothetical protein
MTRPAKPKPWKRGNRKLREFDQKRRLVVKIYCAKGHLQAGVIWDGGENAFLVNGDGMGPLLPPDVTGRELVYCGCSAGSQQFVDLAKVRRVFDQRNWDRPGSTSVRFEDVVWRRQT